MKMMQHMYTRHKEKLSRWAKIGSKAILASFIGLILISCVTPPEKPVQTFIASDVPSVLVVTSNQSVERYRLAEDAFMKTMHDTNIQTINLQNNHAPVETIQDAMNSNHYDVIYGIGAKALGSIDHIAPEHPTVFSSVLNWRQFQQQPNYYGVSSDNAPASQLAMFKHFFPDVKRLTVLFSKTNRALVKQALKACRELGLTLNAIEIDTPRDLSIYLDDAFNNTDALWLISDPVVLDSTKNARLIFNRAEQAKRPVFATNEFFSEYGSTLTISADLPTVGRQAVIYVNKLIKQQPPAMKVQFPAGSKISLNLKKVESYQLHLNYDALDSVNDLIE